MSGQGHVTTRQVRSSQVRLGHAMTRSRHIWSGQSQVGACHVMSGQYKVRSGKLASGYDRSGQIGANWVKS